MKDCLITFRSVTMAQRGERLLMKANIRCALRRTPKWMEAKGCGYSLRVRQQEALRCAELLREHQIPVGKIYLMGENGEAQELVI